MRVFGAHAVTARGMIRANYVRRLVTSPPIQTRLPHSTRATNQWKSVRQSSRKAKHGVKRVHRIGIEVDS